MGLYQNSAEFGSAPAGTRRKNALYGGVEITLDSKGRQADRQQAYGYMCGVIGMLTMVCQYHRSRGSWHVSSHTNMRQVNNPR